jgi:hypothetical protein
MSAFVLGWDASYCKCHYRLRHVCIPLVVPFILGSPVRLPGRRVATTVLAAAAVLKSVCARTCLRAHPHVGAPTHTHAFSRQGKLGTFLCLPIPSRARRRTAHCEPRPRR